MKVILNDKTEEIADNSTINDLISKELGDKTRGIAVALNQSVVPKSEWTKTHLRSDDNILIIKATQGG